MDMCVLDPTFLEKQSFQLNGLCCVLEIYTMAMLGLTPATSGSGVILGIGISRTEGASGDVE